ncbi:MAG: DUF3047 domain-containing protein [Alphaproteobacteria bacterium]
MMPRKIIYMSLLCLAAFMLHPSSVCAERISAAAETKSLAGWKEYIFKGQTLYSMDSSLASGVIKASCITTASALYQENAADLRKTPILRWSWKVDGVHSQLQEREKSGDDYSARVYAVYTPNRFMPWRTLAVDYVWSNNQDISSVWRNAFTNNAVMIALQSGAPKSGQGWKHESRNIREDFKAFFDIEVDSIDGIAIMTDCDNGQLPMTGYYKDIHFTTE